MNHSIVSSMPGGLRPEYRLRALGDDEVEQRVIQVCSDVLAAPINVLLAIVRLLEQGCIFYYAGGPLLGFR